MTTWLDIIALAIIIGVPAALYLIPLLLVDRD